MLSCVFRLPPVSGSQYLPARFDHSDYGSSIAPPGWDVATNVVNDEEQNEVSCLSILRYLLPLDQKN
jgi:hypothetical protein